MMCFLLDIHSELSADLQRVLEDDLVLLQQQIENLRLEQLHNDLKNFCERLDKQQPLHRALTIPFFAGPNAPSGNISYFSSSIAFEFLHRFGNCQTCSRSNITSVENLCTENSLH